MSSNRLSLLASGVLVAITLSACSSVPTGKPAVSPPPAPAPAQKNAEAPRKVLSRVTFAALPDWDKDDLRGAWPAFMKSCKVLARKPEWKEPCTVAGEVDATSEKAIRTFFESFFDPYQVNNLDGSDNGMVTGYYEPLLRGARKRGGAFQTPLHGPPDDMLTIDMSELYPELKGLRLRGRVVGNKVIPYRSRAEMTQAGTLRGKELMWVDDPIEAFFLQVQGSGRVNLVDTKEMVRVAYADQNGHPYKSIGRYLVDQGEMTLEQASAQSIKAWFVANPGRQQELLQANPSYVFFREEKLEGAIAGPKGALGVPLTPERSIAVDPKFVPLGAPVYLATTYPGKDTPLKRLMMAQDTGGAIKNPVRADLFWGFGASAGELAGRMKQRGSMWVLLPKGAPAPL